MRKQKPKEWRQLSPYWQRKFKRKRYDSYPALEALSVRIHNCLNNSAIITMADLLRTCEGDSLKWRNFGKHSFNALQGALKSLGFKLSTKRYRKRSEPEPDIHGPEKHSIDPPEVLPPLPKKYDTKSVEPLIVSTATGKIYIYRVTSADGKTMKFFDSVTAAQACYSAMGSGHVDQIHIFPTAENIAYILNDHLELVGMKNKDRFDLWEKGKFGNGGMSNSMLQIPHYGGLK